MIPNT